MVSEVTRSHPQRLLLLGLQHFPPSPKWPEEQNAGLAQSSQAGDDPF